MATGVPDRLSVEYLPVAQLRPYFRNSHQGNVKRIRGSLREHGQFKAIVVNRGTHTGREWEVLCGSHTLYAAMEEGATELAAHVVDVDDERAAKINLVDNPRPNHPEDLGYDDRLLLEQLAELDDLTGAGYELDDLANLESLLDDNAWGRGGSKAGGDGESDVDDAAMWPRIDMRVPTEVFDGWRLFLDKHPGKTDSVKLKAALEELGLL